LTITVRLFAHLRETLGEDQIQVDLEEGATVAALRDLIGRSFPQLLGELEKFPVVVEGEMATLDQPLQDGQEVAWIPPVAGGSTGEVRHAFLTHEPLDADALRESVQHDGAGAIAMFLGVVRDHEGERAVTELEYEAYQQLAERRLRLLAEKALGRWPEARIAVAHRTGLLQLGETSVIVAVSTPHRADAFECCRTLMDWIKSGVPIWKKSTGPDGSRWVAGKTYTPSDR